MTLTGRGCDDVYEVFLGLPSLMFRLRRLMLLPIFLFAFAWFGLCGSGGCCFIGVTDTWACVMYVLVPICYCRN